jgi:hypothetical protein
VFCFSDPVIDLKSKSFHQSFLSWPRTISSPNLLFLNAIFTSPRVGNNTTTTQLPFRSHDITALLFGRKSPVFIRWGAGWAFELVRRLLTTIFLSSRTLELLLLSYNLQTTYSSSISFCYISTSQFPSEGPEANYLHSDSIIFRLCFSPASYYSPDVRKLDVVYASVIQAVIVHNKPCLTF